MPGWIEQRAQARRDIHAAFSYACTYEDDVVVVPKKLTVRWHSKPEFVGNINNGDYADIFTTVRRLLFNLEEVTAAGITLKRGGLIKLTDFNNYPFKLDAQEEPDGPIKDTWSVARP